MKKNLRCMTSNFIVSFSFLLYGAHSLALPNEFETQIISVGSSKCVDIDKSTEQGMENRANVVQKECEDSTSQNWSFLKVKEPDIYQVKSKHSEKCLEVSMDEAPYTGKQNGANIHQQACEDSDSGNKNQFWKLQPLISGSYKLVAEHSGKCFDVGSPRGDGTLSVHQFRCKSHDDNQKWQINLKISGRKLDIKGRTQFKTQWCWAAVAQTVRKYITNVDRRQCKMASSLIAKTTDPICCGNDNEYESFTRFPSELEVKCNQPYFLNKVLNWNRIAHNYYREPIEPLEVKADIDANKPVPIRIGWQNGGGHFILIYGYHGLEGQTPDFYFVWDPGRGRGAASLDAGSSSLYLGSGSWTHTYRLSDQTSGIDNWLFHH